MSAESKRQLMDQRGDGFDGVRDRLLLLIKFHDAIGHEMNKVRAEQMERAAGRPRDSEAEQVEACQRLMTCLRLFAETTADKEPKEEEEHPSSVSYLLAKQALESAERRNEIAEEFKVGNAHLRALSRDLLALHDRMQASHDGIAGFVFLILAVALYLFMR
ncbi:hypothetical protein PHYPSEUDO_014071 [Phytophthora pseudosyringae]|uniref:Uncharacterized protein n=1 Tax=Phytophthora pseudosyringae TaxID=221518 RepID=A0A8T1V7Z0_9STRA|nr:hypothetical protein PHYPSEUDO_014071 [Phytophthora pseudosyringae]